MKKKELRMKNFICQLLRLKTVVLIDDKSFFGIPIMNKEEACEKIIEMGRNNDYTTGNLLD